MVWKRPLNLAHPNVSLRISRRGRGVFFLGHENFHDPFPSSEHLAAIQPDYDDGNRYPQDVVPGLGIRKYGIRGFLPNPSKWSNPDLHFDAREVNFL